MVDASRTGRMAVYALVAIVLPVLSGCAGGSVEAKVSSSCTPPAPTSFAERHAFVSNVNTVSAVDLRLLSESQGWVLTQRGLFWTVDCGQHWQRITPPGVPAWTITSAFFLDTSHGWISAGFQHPRVFRTADGGNHWDDSPAPSYGRLWFADKQTGWLSWAGYPNTEANPGFRVGQLFRTSDGGIHWSAVAGTNGGVVRFVSRSAGWSTNDRRDVLYATNDGGDSWTQVRILPPAGREHENPQFQLPTFLTKMDGVLPVTFRPSVSAAIYRTNDGGRTWSLGTMLVAPRAAGDAVFDVINGETWMIAFTSGAGSGTDVIHLTDDGGQTWSAVSSRGMPMVGGLDFVSPRVGWAVPWTYSCAAVGSSCGYREDLMLSIDGGHSWAPLNLEVG